MSHKFKEDKTNWHYQTLADEYFDTGFYYDNIVVDTNATKIRVIFDGEEEIGQISLDVYHDGSYGLVDIYSENHLEEEIKNWIAETDCTEFVEYEDII
jgi:hypothetical protein